MTASSHPSTPAASALPPSVYADGLSDVSIAGDPLAWPHLAPEPLTQPTTVGDFAALARRVAAERDRWERLVRYDALTRWYSRLETGPGYEVWLLSWLPGQGTGAHDHGRSSAVMTVLQGELTELGAGRGPRALTVGTQRVITPGYVHEVVNDTLEPAVSLHVYFPGLTQMPRHPGHTLGQGTTGGRRTTEVQATTGGQGALFA